jgi:hypothetical protein
MRWRLPANSLTGAVPVHGVVVTILETTNIAGVAIHHGTLAAWVPLKRKFLNLSL